MKMWEGRSDKKTRRRPLVWISMAFIAGIGFGGYRQAPLVYLCAGMIVCLLFCILCFRRPRLSSMALLALLMFLGAIHMALYSLRPSDSIADTGRYYYKRPARLKGVIVSDVEDRMSARIPRTRFTLRVTHREAPGGWVDCSGRVLVDLFRREALVYGDEILIEGKLHRPYQFDPDGSFSYRDYLERQGIHYILSVKKQGLVEVHAQDRGHRVKSLAFRYKARIRSVLIQHLSVNEAGLMQAVLLGDRYPVPGHIRELFEVSGVAHILAISGLHIGIVAAILMLLSSFLPMPRRWRGVFVFGLLAFYALLTGARPPVVRSVVMAGVILGGFIFEREPDTLSSLSLAALLLNILNPYLVFDLGFQLSFLSVLSIVILYPFLTGLAKRWAVYQRYRFVRLFVQSMTVSLSAYTGVAGLIIYHFHIVTPLGILSNLLVVPLITLVVALGLGLSLAGLIWFPAASLLAVCLKLTINLMVGGVFLCAQIPGAYVQLDSVAWWVPAVYYFTFFSLLLGRIFWKQEKNLGKDIKRCQ